jgi:hypothetical protein
MASCGKLTAAQKSEQENITLGSTATGNSLCAFCKGWLPRRVSLDVEAVEKAT